MMTETKLGNRSELFWWRQAKCSKPSTDRHALFIWRAGPHVKSHQLTVHCSRQGCC